ncbi:MAG: cold-shock protein [Anderseniella sp.]
MRHTGTVKFFNSAKGYGFISPEDGSKDIFVHVTAVQAAGIPELKDGARLSYELHDDKHGRGQQATELQLL